MENIHDYNTIIKQMRSFFQDEKGFAEIPAQSRLSILAACEDPKTISQFVFSGMNYPLPQTGQMWLEYELLKNKELNGVFCQTTSYRNEPNPIPGRHDKIFPMFEFESKGDIKKLKELEKELLNFFGFPEPISLLYENMCTCFNTDTLESEHEEMMYRQFGSSISLEMFPQRTHPFWNMKHGKNGVFNKVDVLLYGMETIGSAERSTNIEEMYKNFLSISDGQYSKLLFNQFGQKRVMEELENYLSLPMFKRYGGGIGITRMARAMRLHGLIR
ncbi:MAG: amino acid--tRNA ligase-related protein [Candidatus Woesearchaeota archaeon]